MKSQQIIKILNENYDKIVEAIKEADSEAYKYRNLSHSVAVYEDGTVEVRSRLAGDNSWYQNDTAIAEIGGGCYQYSEGAFENYDPRELERDLLAECTHEERDEYNLYLADYLRKQRKFWGDDDEYTPVWFEKFEWFKEHCDAWKRLYNKCVDEIVNEAESDGVYSGILDEYIKALEHIAQYE